jgi:16S rRNA (guanine966-N2)-methyltransferase
MRIVGGQFRGRLLAAPAHEGTRPTSDRAREAMFNILAHGIPGFDLAGARVLDLFAGTGALGLEARALIRRNVEVLGLTGITKIFRRDATELGPAGRYSGFTLAFLDPPYGHGLAEQALASAADGGWLAPGAIAVIEERKGTAIVLPAGFGALDQRAWGDTQALFTRFTGGQS